MIMNGQKQISVAERADEVGEVDEVGQAGGLGARRLPLIRPESKKKIEMNLISLRRLRKRMWN